MKAATRMVLAAALLATGTTTAASSATAEQPALLSLGVGQFDNVTVDPGFLYFDINPNKPHNQALDLRMEYRSSLSLLPRFEPYVSIRPWVGVEVTGDGAAYGAGGVLFDVPVGSFVFTPSFGAGVFASGDGKKMGSALEFRSQLELGYMFENHSRFSIAYSHISNADLTETNPGANSVTLYYHLPTSWLWSP